MKMKTISSVRRCRLCACEDNLDTFCNIFEDSALNIEMKITKLLPVVVMPGDPMTHKICNSCIEKLNSFDEFYEGSLRAEKILLALYPCGQNQLRNFEPIERSVLDEVPFVLPLKDRVPLSSSLNRASPRQLRSPESLDWREQLRRCFVINELTSKDFIFTCRKCFRTFTKESSALTHTCVRLEDCQEFASLDVEMDEEQEKLLPPLKIRLFSMESGLFVCDLCQSPFKKKAELVAHIKKHFLEGSWSEEEGRRTGEGKMAKEKRRECIEEVRKESQKQGMKKEEGKENEEGKKGIEREKEKDEEDCLGGVKKKMTKSAKATRKRKKSCEKFGRKRERVRRVDAEGEKGEAVGGNSHEQISLNSFSSEKDAMESATPRCDLLNVSEDEIEIKFEKVQKMSEEIPRVESNKQDENEVQDSCLKTSKTDEVEEQRSDVALVSKETVSNTVVEDDVILEEGTDRLDDVTVVQVVNNRAPTSFSSCVICDKIFATKSALVSHQEKHLQSCSGVKEPPTVHSDPYLCAICSMSFSTKKTLNEHEQYHLVDVNAMG